MSRLEKIEKKSKPEWEFGHTVPPQQYVSWLSPEDTDWLISELHRLRAAIEKHKKWHDDYQWQYGEGDAELYKILEE